MIEAITISSVATWRECESHSYGTMPNMTIAQPIGMLMMLPFSMLIAMGAFLAVAGKGEHWRSMQFYFMVAGLVAVVPGVLTVLVVLPGYLSYAVALSLVLAVAILIYAYFRERIARSFYLFAVALILFHVPIWQMSVQTGDGRLLALTTALIALIGGISFGIGARKSGIGK